MAVHPILGKHMTPYSRAGIAAAAKNLQKVVNKPNGELSQATDGLYIAIMRAYAKQLKIVLPRSLLDTLYRSIRLEIQHDSTISVSLMKKLFRSATLEPHQYLYIVTIVSNNNGTKSITNDIEW